jgi:trehalose 6-phosphate synthase/phosphatase
VELFAQPLGVDVEAWAGRADPAAVQAEVRDVRRAAAGRRVILGVERLDYTKGIPQRLLAFRELLSARPELAEELVFFQIAVPSRVDVDAYRELRQEVDRLAGEINGRFGRVGLQPLHYQFHGVDPGRLTALYRCADVCMVTPLRDGLNLVAKEFVVTAGDAAKTLILSEFAGAQVELKHAIAANPYAPASMDAALREALGMPGPEQQRRMAAMDRIVRGHDIVAWAEAFLAAMTRPAALLRIA